MMIIQGAEWNFYRFTSKKRGFYTHHSLLAVLCNGNAYEGEDNPLDGFSEELAERFKIAVASVFKKAEHESDLECESRAVYPGLDERNVQYLERHRAYMDEQASKVRERYSEDGSKEAEIRIVTYEPFSPPFDGLDRLKKSADDVLLATI
jgi:hypothetical protein